MLNGYKIICVTPAGRRRYLKSLIPQILVSPLVDEYHLWRNTNDQLDADYIYGLEIVDSRIKVIEPHSIQPGSNAAIRQFYKNCTDDKTIYIRFDDDVVFIESDFFYKFITFRVANPEYFLVFPNIINNAVCTYVQFTRGALNPAAWIHPWCMDPTTWGNPHFAEQLHRAFLSSVAENNVSHWYFGPKLIALSRFSINCMAWFGRDFATFQGQVLGDEEEFLSVIKPSELGRLNCIYGDAVVAHFAFHPQRKYLDCTDLLQMYESSHRQTREAVLENSLVIEKNLWTPRLLSAMARIANANESDLANEEFVASQIRYAGLLRDRRMLYGEDNQYMNTEKTGLWQIPMQLARLLVHLRSYDIRSVLDVGTASGWTISIVTAYLARFNKNLRVTTIDSNNYFECYASIKDKIPLEFICNKSSKDFAGRSYDFVFIDAIHTYDGCRADYEAVGINAAICGFHDIQDRFVSGQAENYGGVPRFWEELKMQREQSSHIFEFLDHPNDDKIMGIGIIVKSQEQRKGL